MPCRYAGGLDRDRSERGIDKGQFLRSALVIGSKEALATAVTRHGQPDVGDGDGDDVGEVDRGDSQHAWDVRPDPAEACPAHAEGGGGSHDSHDGHDDHGTDGEEADACPAHGEGDPEEPADHGDAEEASDDHDHDSEPSPLFHLVLRLDYRGDVPDESDRETVEAALESLEETFGWGPDGLLFTMGYSPSYFDRFEQPLPESLRGAEGVDSNPTVVADGARVDTHDALLHVASDDARILLAAEHALWGEQTVVDVELDATFEGVFSRPRDPPARRSAVATDEAYLPDGETTLTGDAGQFAGGTVQRVRTLPPESDSGSDEASGCPAHGDDGGSHDADQGSHGDAGGCPAHDEASEESAGAELRGLNPADPATVEFELTGVDAEPSSKGESRRTEAYVVPPVSVRSLPTTGS